MLIQFSFRNFLSFKEQATLSLVTSALKEAKVDDADVMAPVGDSIGSVLHGAAVYGANASGKSNLVKALSIFQWIVVNSMKESQAGERLRVESFRLNSKTAAEPSMFEIVFCDAETIYRYGIEIDEKQVWREWLYQRANRKRAKEVELIFRDGDNYTIHPKLSIPRDLAGRKMIRNNALLLSVSAQFNDPTSVRITQELADIVVLTNHDDDRMWNLATFRLDDADVRRRIVAFSQYADLGIEDIEKVNDVIVSRHAQYDENGKPTNNVFFPMEENESEGTIKYFQLAYPILDALENGKSLVIDELDSRLHPILTNRIVSMFHSARTNPHHAQLIFTLHDTNILDAAIIRRDQVWFTQKDRFGASELFSLAEYNVRSNAPFEKDYLAGKYGAIPVVGNIERILGQ